MGFVKRQFLLGGVVLACVAQTNAGMVDEKLLDMLLANGAITGAQHAELMGDLARERQGTIRTNGEALEKKDFVAFRSAAGWVENTVLRGDVRLRH